MATFLVSGGFVCFPIIPYVPQLLSVQRRGEIQGFSSRTCLILLLANITRVWFWAAKRFDSTLLFQSLVMVAAQIALLHAVVAAKDRLPPLPQYTFFSGFWEWTTHQPYYIFLASFAVVLGVAVALLSQDHWAIGVLGAASVGLECLLSALPMLRVFIRGDTRGIPVSKVQVWLLGDTAKLAYCLATGAPPQFIYGALTQVASDLVLNLQLFVLYPSRETSRLLQEYVHAPTATVGGGIRGVAEGLSEKLGKRTVHLHRE